jgi:hypothetical protein
MLLAYPEVLGISIGAYGVRGVSERASGLTPPRGPRRGDRQPDQDRGGFRIDHPLDPANRYLNHSFVESSDRKNIYDGIAVLDSRGEAVVGLPAWVEAANRDFRYQLTPIGAAAPNPHVAREVSKGRFKIGGGPGRMRVSWQITGIRRDVWAKANALEVEEKRQSQAPIVLEWRPIPLTRVLPRILMGSPPCPDRG